MKYRLKNGGNIFHYGFENQTKLINKILKYFEKNIPLRMEAFEVVKVFDDYFDFMKEYVSYNFLYTGQGSFFIQLYFLNENKPGNV